METVTVLELRSMLGRRVDAAHYSGDVTVITKNGERRAVLMSAEQYDRLTADPGDLSR